MKFKTHTMLVVCLLLLNSVFSFSQRKTYFGIEIGPKFELYKKKKDTGGQLKTVPIFSTPIYGAIIGHEINSKFVLETGVYFNDYSEGYKMEGEVGFTSGNAVFLMQFPLRLKTKINLGKRVTILPTVGIHLGMIPFFFEDDIGYGNGFHQISTNADIDSINVSEMGFYNFQRFFGLVELGLSYEFRNHDNSVFFVTANLLKGWNKIIQLDVDYKINDNPVEHASIISNGDYFSLLVGYKYPISNFWQKNNKKKIKLKD